ncbi:hypothetical protein SAMN02745178_01365 [Gemmiger formicilis]|uniref:Gram-positive cocci surface proteins LPxTG domain-containing protein n=1 Tax=Gemmiger formicilis TaxID=745368 RepID=A0A1T4X373_9FIRM|nr:pectate lyase-like adhesive domain-containing protein [Gemmiger formicilis]SKA84064.1 hypothetical protein SAMN02745178_01365 [Gemmiger formicilis]
MKKQIVSTLLALCMLLCLMPTAAFAEDRTETPPVCSCETACTAEAMNADCPICGAEGALPENCAKCAQPADDAAAQPEDSADNPPVCSCETACTAESMNESCPVCGAEGALPENCAKYAQPADDAAAQPEGEVSDPQPEAALTALSGEGVTPAAGETVRDVRTADELTAAIADSSVNTVKLAGDISISSFLTVTRTVTLDLNGHVLKYKSTNEGSVIVVKDGVNLTLTDSNTTAVHKFTPDTNGLWVLDEASGTETVNGGVITGGTGKPIQFGSGKYVYDAYYGGGVYIAPGGQLTMTGGNIVGCSAEFGGGICIESERDGKQGQFSMSGGNIIGCSAECGGGVYVDSESNQSPFSMSGGSIIGCVASDIGGGVRASGTFKMSGQAVIRSCTVESATQSIYGGGIYVNSSSSFEMSGEAKIEYCQAISNSSKSSNGGGVYLTNNTKFTLSGNAVIQNCKADNSVTPGETYGGGVSADCMRQITLEGNAQIFQCAAVNGSGLYITGSLMYPNDWGKLYANGGSVNGDVVLGDKDKYDGPCTITGLGGTVFNGKVTVTPDSTIEKGTFNGEVINNGTITGGVFNSTVSGNGTITGGTFNTPMTGSGTESDPYQISTAAQLKRFRDIVNGSNGQTPNRGACAVLTADIDLNNEPWTPIGPDTDSAYTGAFDGQGYTVRNLSITGDFKRAGLFGCVKDGSIRKLTVAGSVSCTVDYGWCGGIAGCAERETIENCASLCTISYTGKDARVGGIVGWVPNSSSSTIIRDCYNIGNITGGSDTGGICGFYLTGNIFNCYNVGEITGGEYIDNIAGYYINNPTNCYYLSNTDTDPAAKTAAQFADGTVLTLLKAGRNDSPWDSCQYVAAAKMTLPVFKGQGDTHEHTWSAWTPNGDGTHSRSCACGVAETKACTITPATCTEKAKCTVCGAEYGNVLGHDFTTSWTHDDNEHWKQCSRCDEKKDVSSHTWDSGTVTTASTCTKAGEKTYTCTKCGATKTDSINATGHSWKSDWTSDATHHWHECANKNCDVTDNSGKYGYAEHSGGTATCTEKAVCTHCGQSYGETDPANHTGTEQWTQTAKTHEKKWSCCGVITVQSENHKWTDGVCSECGYVCLHDDTDKNHICDICGKTISEHKDADNNHICDYCNKKISDHSGGTATCIAKAVCEICGKSYGSLDPNNHTDLKHIDAKAATAAEEGNIAYWYCDDCKRYFSDAAAKTEITKADTVTAKLPPQITAGDGAAVTQGEKNELTFTSNASFADFIRVELDGATLEEKNYTKREGSTIITLNRDFVAALSVGEHTLAIVSQHGTATAKFTVKAKPTETATPQPTETTTPQPTAQPQQTAQPQPTVQPTVQPVSPIPRTGDTANPALWFALLIVSGSALAAIFVLRRKDNRK